MMAVVIASGRLYAECRYFNYPTLYKAEGQSVSSRFFEGLVSFTGAQFTWPLISFGFWFWSVNLMNNLPKMSYVSDLSGSFEVLFNSGGFWALLLMAMVIVGVSTFSLVLVSEAVKGPLRSTIANEKARIEAKTKGGGEMTVMATGVVIARRRVWSPGKGVATRKWRVLCTWTCKIDLMLYSEQQYIF